MVSNLGYWTLGCWSFTVVYAHEKLSQIGNLSLPLILLGVHRYVSYGMLVSGVRS